MIDIDIYYNKEGCISKVSLKGHAGYGEDGFDIVCAAVSALVINAVNSVEKLTHTGFRVEADEENGGYLEIVLSGISKEYDHDACLLLNSMVMGLSDMQSEYGKYMNLKINPK